MTIRAEFGRAAVRDHRAHFALHAAVLAAAGRAVADPVLAELQVNHVAFFEVDDLVGHAGQRHRIRRQEVLAGALTGADAEHQR